MDFSIFVVKILLAMDFSLSVANLRKGKIKSITIIVFFFRSGCWGVDQEDSPREEGIGIVFWRDGEEGSSNSLVPLLIYLETI